VVALREAYGSGVAKKAGCSQKPGPLTLALDMNARP
jgi:hypothetical protein